jgi:predicted nucleic acid-binding protein
VTAVRANCLDASALVKLYVAEPDSAAVRTYLEGEATWYSTPVCFFEALGVLKRKRNLPEGHPQKIGEEEYHHAGFAMVADFAARSKKLPDLDMTDPRIFTAAQQMCKKYPMLDFADAFQILSVKEGYFSPLCNDSATVLVTADKALATAAENEAIRVHLVR